MPSIEISLSDDLCDSTWQHPSSPARASRMALHHEDKLGEDIPLSRVPSKDNSYHHGDYIDERGRCYHEIIEVTDEAEDHDEARDEDLNKASSLKRTLSEERMAPTNVVGQFQWIIQQNFASRAVPKGVEARKRSPLAVNFVEYRI